MSLKCRKLEVCLLCVGSNIPEVRPQIAVAIAQFREYVAARGSQSYKVLDVMRLLEFLQYQLQRKLRVSVRNCSISAFY